MDTIAHQFYVELLKGKIAELESRDKKPTWRSLWRDLLALLRGNHQ